MLWHPNHRLNGKTRKEVEGKISTSKNHCKKISISKHLLPKIVTVLLYVPQNKLTDGSSEKVNRAN
jgi:hypothetical protein